MARIKGIEIPNNKRIEIGLTSIYGIGRQLSNQILKDAKVDANIKAGDLTEEQLTSIRKEIDKYTVEGDLRREVSMNIKNLKEIKCYRGMRHAKKLPVRGQRTRSNAVTARGGKNKTVANKKK